MMPFDFEGLFDREVIGRGLGYYKDGRVRHVIRDGNEISGIVKGSFDYRVKVNLGSKRVSCNCPYEGNCKHAVALILAYEAGEYIDGSSLRVSLAGMNKESLVDLVFENLLKDERMANKMLARLKIGKKDVQPKDVKSKLYENLFRDFDDPRFGRDFLEAASSVTSGGGESILSFLGEVVKHQNDIANCFVGDDDYGEGRYGGDYYTEDELHDALKWVLDSFFSQKPSEVELKKLQGLVEKDDYGLLDCADSILEHYQHVPEKHAKALLDNRDFVEYLLKHSKTDAAIRVCEDNVQKFEILRTVDKEKALNFGLKKLVPDDANLVARYMAELKVESGRILDVLLKDDDPSFEMLCGIDDAVLERKYKVYDALFKKGRYNTYYLLCKRFKDARAMKKLVDVGLDHALAVLVGKYLLSEYRADALNLLEKTLRKVVKEAYNGYMGDAAEMLGIIKTTDGGFAVKVYDKIARDYPRRSMLKHELKKLLQ